MNKLVILPFVNKKTVILTVARKKDQLPTRSSTQFVLSKHPISTYWCTQTITFSVFKRMSKIYINLDVSIENSVSTITYKYI
jgi:hypothetical protein